MATAQKSDNTLMYVLAGAAGIYFISQHNKAQAAKGGGGGGAEDGAVDPEAVDGVVDQKAEGLTIEGAVAKAQEIAGALQDAKILIKGENGKHLAVRKGKKKIKPTKKRKVKKLHGKALKKGKKLFSAANTTQAFSNFGI